MIEFKWSIEKVKVTGDTNLVTHVYWRCDGVQDDLTACAAGIRELVSGDTFVPYDQLTEQQVLDWCFAPEVITVEDLTQNTTNTITKLLKDEGEAQVTDQIQRRLAQKASEPALPWAV